MPEFLIETIPFIVGAALGWITFDATSPPLSKPWRIILLSLIFGTLQSWLAGELASEWSLSTMAVLFDSAAVCVTPQTSSMRVDSMISAPGPLCAFYLSW
jgi:hypothetical protein